MRNKVVLITAGTGGIGKEIAIGLAKLGATTVVTGRDAMRGPAAVDEIRLRSGGRNVDLLLADLSSQEGVANVAREFRDRYDRLDVLINNVGGLFGRRWETSDGIESTLALNHLCPFLLTHLLLPRLRASAPSRVINVNSEGHRAASAVSFESLEAGRWKRGFHAYSQCKLANLMFTYTLANRLEGSGVTVNAVHPGMVDTQLVRRFISEKLHLRTGRISDLLGGIAAAVARRMYDFDTAQEAALCPMYLASSSEVSGVTGKYFGSDCTMVDSSPASNDKEAAESVWQESTRLLQPKYRSVVEGASSPSLRDL